MSQTPENSGQTPHQPTTAVGGPPGPPSPSGQDGIILHCCTDLLWATRIKSTADALGIPCRPARNLEMLEARLADSKIAGLIVDLETGSVGLSLIDRLRTGAKTEAERGVAIVAFGPHVDVGGLQAAREKGASAVLARGAFSGNLPEILSRLARHDPVVSRLQD